MEVLLRLIALWGLLSILQCAIAAEGDVVELETGEPSPEDQLGTGLTYDSCFSDSDCAPPRYCRRTDLNGQALERCRSLDLTCFCLAFVNFPCNSSATCPFGEACVQLENISACLSCGVVSAEGLRIVDDGRLCDKADDTIVRYTDGEDNDVDSNGENEDAVPVPSQSYFPLQTVGLPPNIPLYTPSQMASPNADSSVPVASPVPESTSSSFASPELTAQFEPETPICIAVSALAHLPASDLVFPVHRHATVLCDAHGSCATAGHIVDFHGSPMMMSTYCRRFTSTACTRRVMLVNSPRIPTRNIHARRLRIDSKTPGLQYTALAARYASTLEEFFVSIFIHLGF